MSASNDNGDNGDNGHAPASTMAVDWSTEPMPVYASGVHVAQTAREFSVIFDDSAPFPGRNAPEGQPDATRSRIVSSLRIPPDVFFRVVCVLASSWNRYVDKWIDPRMPRPRFKLMDAGNVQLDAADPPSKGKVPAP